MYIGEANSRKSVLFSPVLGFGSSYCYPRYDLYELSTLGLESCKIAHPEQTTPSAIKNIGLRRPLATFSGNPTNVMQSPPAANKIPRIMIAIRENEELPLRSLVPQSLQTKRGFLVI